MKTGFSAAIETVGPRPVRSGFARARRPFRAASRDAAMATLSGWIASKAAEQERPHGSLRQVAADARDEGPSAFLYGQAETDSA